MLCKEVPWGHPDAVMLRNAQSADLSARYGSPITLNEPEPERLVSMTVLYDEGPAQLPVGCAALVDFTGVESLFGEAKTVEMRRVFIRPELRGNGFSHGIIDALRKLATEKGFDQIVLVSGTKEPEAVGLYKSQGFTELEPYGVSKDWETALFFQYDLASA